MSHYSNGYAVAILVNDNVVETRQDSIVSVPFGADYVIRLINRNNRRAVAKVSIDGQNVTKDGIIVGVGLEGTVDLRRPLDKAVTFRFASTESTAAADHGKSGPDVDGSKGLITVEWRPEKKIYQYGTGHYGALSKKLDDYTPRHSSLRGSVPTGQSCERSEMMGFSPSYEREELTSGGITLSDVAMNACSSPELQSGVTVEGQYSNQQFRSVAFNIDYIAHPTIVSIKLMGYVENEGIPRTGTLYCPSCRTKTHKKTDKFCRQCGEKL